VELRDLLTGGDRRSIAQADKALQIAREDRAAVDELARLTGDEDWLVAQRACDVLEKLLRERPEWVQPHRQVFFSLLSSPYWETRLQCVRALPLFAWSAKKRRAVVEVLRKAIDDEQKFVRCWALDGFALMVADEPAFQTELLGRVSEFLGSDAPSMRARAKAIAKRLKATPR
jgi:HEAT repeat protein